MANKQSFSIATAGKHVCGSYFNMALTNYGRTLNDIFIRCDIKFSLKSDDIRQRLESLSRIVAGSAEMDTKERKICAFLSDPVVAENLKKQLYKRFPMLGPLMDHQINLDKKNQVSKFTDASLADCLRAVITIGKSLNDLRNFYTHYHPYNTDEEMNVQYKRQSRIACYMNTLFDVSRRLEQKRDGLTANELEYLTGDKYRYRKVGREFKERSDWYFRVFKEIPSFDKKVLSDFGVVYFCSLFLTKNYAYRLFDECKLFVNTPFKEDENAFVREMLTIYRMRMLRGKQLDSHDGHQALAMDMLNELRKCPQPLYQTLSEDDKRKFHVTVLRQNEKTEDFFKMLRSTDRFPYFALRFIDEEQKFSRIRFQIRLGSYRFKFYDKVNIDGTKRVRSLQKEVNGFGRLSDIETERLLKWKGMFQDTEQIDYEDMFGDWQSGVTQFVEDTPATEPYVTNFRAAYNIHNNRIGLYWNEKGRGALDGTQLLYLPELKTDASGKADVVQPSPKASLSVYDLPAMVFYMYLYEKSGLTKDFSSAEQLIISKYDSLVRFFNDVAAGKLTPFESSEALIAKLSEYNLKAKEVPEKLFKWLSGNTEEVKPSDKYAEKLAQEIRERRMRTERRLQRYDEDVKAIGSEKAKPYGKKGHAKIIYSQLARYLARSIMEWQPVREQGRNKLTGQNFNVMVSFLSTLGYSSQVKDLKELFSRARLLEGSSAHPFLGKVLNNTSISNLGDFYRCYLVKEITFLEKKEISLIKTRNIKDVVRQLPFAHFNRLRYQDHDDSYYQQLAGRYLHIDSSDGVSDSVLLLPDGLFTEHLYRLMRHVCSQSEKMSIMLDSEVARHNAAYLISQYFELIENDYPQPYYRYCRSYELFNVLEGKKVRNVLQPQYYHPKDISGKLTEGDANGKAILRQIDRYCRDIQNKGTFDSLEDAREAQCRKLRRLIGDCKDNERAIRRYKTQDVVLFIMAREILKGIVPDYVDKYAGDRYFCLERVCEDGFLSQAVDMEYELPVGLQGRKVKIVQQNMSLKNYGEFQRLLHDERLQSLLTELANIDKVDYASLSGELAIYDQLRSEVFRLVQEIEKHIYEVNHAELDDPSGQYFAVGEKPRLNSFRRLLELLGSDTSLSEHQRELLISIRNAFGHNTYKVNLSELNATELPNVARKIVEKMKQLSETV